MRNGFFDLDQSNAILRERSITRDAAEARVNANALRRQRAALIEAALAEALFQNAETLRGLNPAVVAARIAAAFEG